MVVARVQCMVVEGAARRRRDQGRPEDWDAQRRVGSWWWESYGGDDVEGRHRSVVDCCVVVGRAGGWVGGGAVTIKRWFVL